MSLYIRADSRSRNKTLDRKGALNMYVYIYEIPENFLNTRSLSQVSRYGTPWSLSGKTLNSHAEKLYYLSLTSLAFFYIAQ